MTESPEEQLLREMPENGSITQEQNDMLIARIRTVS